MKKFVSFNSKEGKSVEWTPEQKEAWRKRMTESIRQNKLYRAKAMLSAKKIWIGR